MTENLALGVEFLFIYLFWVRPFRIKENLFVKWIYSNKINGRKKFYFDDFSIFF